MSRVLAILGTAVVSILVSAACPFSYTKEIQHDVVEPAVVAKTSTDTARFFATDKPTITRKGNLVELMIGGYKTVEGRNLLDPNFISITLDACTGKMISSEWVSWMVESAPKK